MPIPCYLADIWKEVQKNSNFSYAQLGFGLKEDGSARISHALPSALCVIDDAICVMPQECALDALASLCKRGCVLDFERACTRAHIVLIQGLRKRTEGFFALPARFHSHCPSAIPVVSCPKPCNHWHSWVQNVQRCFPSGWMLELTPWKHISPCRMQYSKGFLKSALCHYQCDGGITQYYDTKSSVREKLSVASQHGCVAAIGLHQEWYTLKDE